MKNIAFSKVIRLSNRLWEINFRKIPAKENEFNMDVTDAKGQRLRFILYREESGAWRATGDYLPLWIIAGEEILGVAACEEGKIG